MKRILILGVIFLLCLSFAFAGGKQEENKASGGKKPYEIAFLLKATSTDFWSYIQIGGSNYAKEYPDKVNVTFYGAEDELAAEQAVELLENIITRAPDGIVMASVNPESMSPGIEKAEAAGIRVVEINDPVDLFTDKYTSQLVSDNRGGGVLAAKFLKEYLEKMGRPLTGKVAIHSAIAGHPALIDRCEGFETTLNEIAPDLEVLDWRFWDIDILKEIALTEDVIEAEGEDLVCIYIDVGQGVTGAQRVLLEKGLINDIVLIGWDSNPEIVNGLAEGQTKALILQDPFKMGYMGMDTVVRALDGESVVKDNLVPTSIITKELMEKKEIKELLDPTLKQIK